MCAEHRQGTHGCSQIGTGVAGPVQEVAGGPVDEKPGRGRVFSVSAVLEILNYPGGGVGPA